MDSRRFDRMTRTLIEGSSRRVLIHILTGVPLGLAAVSLPSLTDAKQKRRTKNRKPRFNEFGCLNVGQKCRGNDNFCCSGRCRGRKPKPGRRDKSRCVAHNVGGCTAVEGTCSGGRLDCVADGQCYHTTGNAAFCAIAGTCSCGTCTKDKDCEPAFGPGAACIVCDLECDGLDGRPGTACIAAAV